MGIKRTQDDISQHFCGCSTTHTHVPQTSGFHHLCISDLFAYPLLQIAAFAETEARECFFFFFFYLQGGKKQTTQKKKSVTDESI